MQVRYLLFRANPTGDDLLQDTGSTCFQISMQAHQSRIKRKNFEPYTGWVIEVDSSDNSKWRYRLETKRSRIAKSLIFLERSQRPQINSNPWGADVISEKTLRWLPTSALTSPEWATTRRLIFEQESRILQSNTISSFKLSLSLISSFQPRQSQAHSKSIISEQP